MDLEEKLNWLRLLRTETVGPVGFGHLLKKFGTASEAVRRLPDVVQRAGRTTPFTIPSMKDVRLEYESVLAFGGQCIAKTELEYPTMLKNLSDAPPLLFVKGNVGLLKTDLFAIVGARNASLAGQKLAQSFASDLGTQNTTVVSGMARGIDAAAHEGALSTGTIAVLPGGLNVIYPAEHQALYAAISVQGLLVSEAPFDQSVQSSSFARRNRIIAGLCWGILVVEAAEQSGSLMTARLATEYGREVFAVPGNPLDPRSHGSNHLIQQGAQLAQRSSDVFHNRPTASQWMTLKEDPEPFGEPAAPPCAEPSELPTDLFETLATLLTSVPTPTDEVTRALNVPAATVRAALIEMEISGHVARLSGDRVVLLKNSEKK